MYLKGGENLNTVNFLFQQSNVSVPKSTHSINGNNGQKFGSSLEEQLENNSVSMKERSQTNRLGIDKEVGQFVKMFLDRKSTRLNSSHVSISYAVFCLKKK